MSLLFMHDLYLKLNVHVLDDYEEILSHIF